MKRRYSAASMKKRNEKALKLAEREIEYVKVRVTGTDEKRLVKSVLKKLDLFNYLIT